METIEHIIQQPAKRTHKTPLLFQHGAWHGAWCWQYWMDYFGSLGYETHAISLPGHGKSPLRKKHINFYTFKDYVDVLAEQIETISPKPVVVGHSLGGAVLQKYLETRQLPGAVLLSTLPSRGILPMALRLMRRHPIHILSGLLTLDLYQWVKTPELAQALFLNKNTAVDVIAFQRQLVSESIMNAIALLFPFAKVNPNRSPMLLLSAQNDAVFTRGEEDVTAKKYGVKNNIIQGQPHDLMLESAWQQVADFIDSWITKEIEVM
jgi:pimeloyl-ACP methyl ester carboxylesterase